MTHRVRFPVFTLIFSWGVGAFAYVPVIVGKTPERLFSGASQVVIAREGKRTAVTVASTYRGGQKEFVLIIPVPTLLTPEQVSVGELQSVQRLDAFSAPRIVESSDQDPCEPQSTKKSSKIIEGLAPGASLGFGRDAAADAGDYKLITLNAADTDSLEDWLGRRGYQVPKNIGAAIKESLLKGMKFLLVEITLSGTDATAYRFLRPIQFAFEADDLSIPLTLGKAGVEKEQEVSFYFVTRRGRVLPQDLKLVSLPAGVEIPEFVKEKFPAFYRAVFSKQFEKDDSKALVLEYAWNMGWCDPCATDPLNTEELRQLGVFWLDEGDSTKKSQMIWPPGGGPVEAFVTRIHARQGAEERLLFREAKTAENFQAKFAIRHPWIPPQRACAQATDYMRRAKGRRESEAQTLVGLTGWAIEDVYKQMGAQSVLLDQERKWYEKIFK
ncbi:MAG: DUF2330 domain-containing protein [Bdellovibrionales bacterium]|nr:DUF2330 domain-containing protein [Bdellovibrionales bacterium]